MSLYETMFNQFDITTSQLLVTAFDFTSPERRRNIQYVISELLALGIVPLLNENDAVSANQGYQLFGNSFADNDSLASLVSIEMSAQLLILLTDVRGVFDRPPSDPHSQLIDVFSRTTAFQAGDKSLQGRGGMSAKVDAALRAVDGGVQAVIIAAGHQFGVIDKIMEGEKEGTLFLHNDGDIDPVQGEISTSDDGANGASLSASDASTKVEEEEHGRAEDMARAARDGGRRLQALSGSERDAILSGIAAAIEAREAEILAVNAADVDKAQKRQEITLL